MDWLHCNICFSKYEETLARPCVLPCGHTYCHHCIDATILDSTLPCPECRQKHNIVSASQLPLNYVLVGLIEQLNVGRDLDNEPSHETSEESNQSNCDAEGFGATLFEKTQKSFENQKGLLKISAGMCHEHINNELKYRCTKHKSWICCECISEDHPLDTCTVISFQEEIESRKVDQKNFLETELQCCQKSLDQLKIYSEQLEIEKENQEKTLLELKSVQEKHMSVKEQLVTEQAAVYQLLEEGRCQHQELSNKEFLVSGVSTLHDSNMARQELKKKASEANEWSKLSCNKCDSSKKIKNSVECRMATELALKLHDVCLFGTCVSRSTKEIKVDPSDELLTAENDEKIVKQEENRVLGQRLVKKEETDKERENKIKVFLKVISDALLPLCEARNARTNNKEVRLYGKLLQPPLNQLLPQLLAEALICQSNTVCTKNISFDEENSLDLMVAPPLDNTERNAIPLGQRPFGISTREIKPLAYAVLTEDTVSSEFAVSRIARITVKDGRLHLHALKKHVPLPEDAICFPYSVLRNMVDMTQALTFLDVGWGGSSSMGRVYTRMLGDTPRSNQYVWFCTGEKGPSYVNTVFCAHSNKGRPGEWLGIGDGRFTIPLVSDLTTGADYCHPKEAGIISAVRMGDDNACQNGKFGVTIKGSPGKSSVAFGRVESGLSVFELVAELGQINQASVIDCGIVIPL